MLTFEDCLAFCELTEEEILAIAEHEHLPAMLAIELGSCIIHGPKGELLIERMIIDDILGAQKRGDFTRAAKLKRTLQHFVEEHPAASDHAHSQHAS